MIYETKGTCAKEIKLEVDHGIIQSVENGDVWSGHLHSKSKEVLCLILIVDGQK